MKPTQTNDIDRTPEGHTSVPAIPSPHAPERITLVSDHKGMSAGDRGQVVDTPVTHADPNHLAPMQGAISDMYDAVNAVAEAGADNDD
jgi:hypothetical protein